MMANCTILKVKWYVLITCIRTGFESVFPIISSFGEKNLSMGCLCFMEINIDKVSDIRYVIVNQ